MKRQTSIIISLDRLLISSVRLQVVALITFTLLIILCGSIMVVVFGRFATISEGLWWSFLRITDPGNLATDNMAAPRIIGSVVAISGWIVFGLLISILSTGIQARLAEINKGKSALTVREHTLILGWNQTVISILDELEAGFFGEKAPVIVMSEKPVEEMYSEIKRWCKVANEKTVVCRTGNRESVNDLRRVQAPKAKEILVLNDTTSQNSLHADASVLKTVLAYSKCVEDNKNSAVKMVAELSRPISLSLINSISQNSFTVNNGTFLPVLSSSILGKLLAQCALQPGLSNVYRELFSFRHTDDIDRKISSEIYTVRLGEAGISEPIRFDQMYFERSIPIGYRQKNKEPVLNPGWNSDEASVLLLPSDSVICIACRREDVKGISLFHDPVEVKLVPAEETEVEVEPQKALILGTGYKASVVVNELSLFLPAGSTIVCSSPLKNIQVTRKDIRIDTWNLSDIQDTLYRLCTSGLDDFDFVIFAEDYVEQRSHDASTLMMLAGINSVCGHRTQHLRIVVELVDTNNVELAQKANADDVIIGLELASNYMVQLVREPERYTVYNELLSASGNEIYIKPLSLYTKEGTTIPTFRSVMAVARLRNEIAIGYIFEKDSMQCILNPVPEDRDIPLDDTTRIIVLA